MTLHVAKGLEFPAVFLVGMEDGIFPHSRSLDDPAGIEEERRLFYVGITRARKYLYLSHAWSRTVFGSTSPAIASRFMSEIPDELVRDSGLSYMRRPDQARMPGDDRRGGSYGGDPWGDRDEERRLEVLRTRGGPTPHCSQGGEGAVPTGRFVQGRFVQGRFVQEGRLRLRRP